MQSIEPLKISKTHHFPSINLAYIFQSIMRLVHRIPDIAPPELFHRIYILVESFGYYLGKPGDCNKLSRFYYCSNMCKLENAIECFLRNLVCLFAHFTNLFAAIVDLIDMTPNQTIFTQPIYSMALQHNWSYIETVFQNQEVIKQMQFYCSDNAILEYSRTYLLKVYKINQIATMPFDKIEELAVGISLYRIHHHVSIKIK